MLPKFLTLALFLVSFPCVLFSSALPFGKFFGTRASIALPRAVADTGEPGPVWSRSIDERGDVTEIEDKSTSSNNEFCDATEEGCKKKETTTGEGNSQGTSAPPTCPPNSQHCLKDAYGLYTISPTSQPTLCLRPDYGNPKILTAGTLLKYETCQDGYPNQLWNIRFGGDGTTRIQFAGSKSTMAYCLDAGSTPNVEGFPLKLWTCDDSYAQQSWVITQPNSKEWIYAFELEKQPELFMDLTNGNVGSTFPLQLWGMPDLVPNRNQRWEIRQAAVGPLCQCPTA